MRAGAVAAALPGLRTLLAHSTATHTGVLTLEQSLSILGPLVPDPAGILDLPPGFAYNVISRTGDVMDDGFLVPAQPDGMAAFPGPAGKVILIRNHEITNEPRHASAFEGRDDLRKKFLDGPIYDKGSATPPKGGTTTVVYSLRERAVDRQFLSLAGTTYNCAGGPTPWGTWLSCEEFVASAGGKFKRPHGYVFEVPATSVIGRVNPVPLVEMGRFKHEAVAVNPSSGCIYQTEDLEDGAIYRFTPGFAGPLRAGDLARGGRLQALRIIGRDSLDTRNWDAATVKPGEAMRIAWVDLDDVDNPDDRLRYRAFDKGAARFARGEGMWWGQSAGRGCVYFACTTGGEKRAGQIWKLTPSRGEGRLALREEAPVATLELFIEPDDTSVLENADNITFAPWGDLVVCEDGPGDQFLLGVTPKGQVYKLARNARSEGEFAGATFSPDGTSLFVNMQVDGMTLAVTGPWPRA